MIRDQAILVRPDGSVMFDSPAPTARQGVEPRDAWRSRTVNKAIAEQAKRGVTLTMASRIAPEERPSSKVRDAIRMGVDGRLVVLFDLARQQLAKRFQVEAGLRLAALRGAAEIAAWFVLGDADSWAVRLAALQTEAQRLGVALRDAASVADLLTIKPRWPGDAA